MASSSSSGWPTRDILANARRDAKRYGLDGYFIVDVDSHHVELDSWPEIIDHLQDPVLRDIIAPTGTVVRRTIRR